MDTHTGESLSPADETEVLVISDPIATFLYSEKCFWISVGEVNDIKINGNPAEFVPIKMLNEDTVTISYQMLGVHPATSDDNPGQQNDWRTYAIQEHSFTVPSHLIQVMNPTISVTHMNIPFYLFQSSVLVALTASIFRRLTPPHLKSVPKIASGQEYPYHETLGESNGISSYMKILTTIDQAGHVLSVRLTKKLRRMEHRVVHVALQH